ncbi:hypothetical protein HK405_010175, partial [Cladochytrium tenue]
SGGRKTVFGGTWNVKDTCIAVLRKSYNMESGLRGGTDEVNGVRVVVRVENAQKGTCYPSF